MSPNLPAVVDFYDRHPINEAQILAALRRRGKDPGGLVPEDLYEWDQDHYGGVGAVDTLGRRAGIGPSSAVLDVCAGLGGPARFLARRFGCRVTGVDLHRGRCAAARRLTALVGLTRQVIMVNADAQALPFEAGAFTAVVSQEGLLHVPDRRPPFASAPASSARADGSASATGSRRRAWPRASTGGSRSGWRRRTSCASSATASCSAAPASPASTRKSSRRNGRASCASACGCTARCARTRWR